MLSVQTHRGTPSKLNLLRKLSLTLRTMKESKDYHCMIGPVPSTSLNNNPEVDRETAKQQVKNLERKEGNVSVAQCQIKEHLQDTFLTKFLGQFNELHDTHFFQRLKDLI